VCSAQSLGFVRDRSLIINNALMLYKKEFKLYNAWDPAALDWEDDPTPEQLAVGSLELTCVCVCACAHAHICACGSVSVGISMRGCVHGYVCLSVYPCVRMLV